MKKLFTSIALAIGLTSTAIADTDFSFTPKAANTADGLYQQVDNSNNFVIVITAASSNSVMLIR